ncbi:MAG: type II secretion system protein N [Pseudomonadota bacterium]
MNRRETSIRFSLAAAAMASVVWTAVPTARHMAGVVVLDAPPPVQLSIPQAEAAPDLSAIFALAPFGRVSVPDAAPESEADSRPDIVLRGIFAARDAASSALLDVNGVPGLYREAMQVADRLEVARITQELVELTDGDATLILRFDSDAEADAPNVIAETAAPPSLMDRLQGGFITPAKYEKPGKPETTAEYIDYWRTRVRKNPQAVLDEIGLRPTDQGYVIADKHDLGVRLAGLRSGDLVRTVNGQPVGDPEVDRRFYDEIAAAGQARIEVERGGRTLSFSFPLR